MRWMVGLIGVVMLSLVGLGYILSSGMEQVVPETREKSTGQATAGPSNSAASASAPDQARPQAVPVKRASRAVRGKRQRLIIPAKKPWGNSPPGAVKRANRERSHKDSHSHSHKAADGSMPENP